MPNPSTSAKQGSPAPAPDPVCQKLDQANQEAREDIKDEFAGKKSETAKEIFKKADGQGMTVASVKSTIPGASATFTTASDGTANAKIPNQKCGGGSSEQKAGLKKKVRTSKAKRHAAKKKKAGALCGGNYQHPVRGKGAHSETKAVNCLTNMGGGMRGGSMTFNINWKGTSAPKSRPESGMPCPACYAMMCHAVTKCQIKVFICDHNNQKQPLSKDDCKDPDGYKKLTQRIDGHPTPGRTPR